MTTRPPHCAPMGLCRLPRRRYTPLHTPLHTRLHKPLQTRLHKPLRTPLHPPIEPLPHFSAALAARCAGGRGRPRPRGPG